MKKTVCIVSLSNNPDCKALNSLKKAAAAIGSCSSVNASRAEDFATAAVSERADIIFAVAETDQFLKAKYCLIKSLSLGAVRSSSLLAAMGDNAPTDPKEKEMHAAIPRGAQAFYTLDGLYSAFVVKKADGSILIFLPLEAERLHQLFASGLGILKKADSPAKNAERSFKHDVKDFIAAGKTAAIAECGFFKVLTLVLSKFENSEFAFIHSPENSKINAEKVSLARSVRKAALFTGVDFGIGISDVLTEPGTNNTYIEVCVATSDFAEVAKVFSHDGEPLKSHVAAAITKLCSMMYSAAENGLSKPEEAAQPSTPPKQAAKKSPLPIILALSGVCAATVISLVVAFMD